jgi:hypothetical protein
VLDLSGSARTVAGVIVARDSDGPDRWLVLPGQPRPTSGADLQLLRFVQNGALTGGYLHLGVDLGVTDAALAAATDALTTENNGKPVTLAPLPLIAAEADLVFFGKDESGSGVVAQHYATSLLDLNPPHHGVFAVTLTADGVRLVEAALRSGAAPIGVQCRLTAEGLWPAARVTAHVDWHSMYEHFSTDYKAGALLFETDVQQLMQRLVQSQAVRVTAVESPAPGAPDDAEKSAVAAAMEFVQTQLVDQFCQPLLPLDTDPAQASLGDVGELLSLGSAYEVKALTEVESATADFDFQQATVTRRLITCLAPLSGLTGGADPSQFIVDAGQDNPFFTTFHLDCRTARPLGESHLAEAILDVSYGTAAQSIRLTPDQATGSFDCYADASPTGTWTITPRVTFAADSPLDPGTAVQLAPQSGSTRDICLDLDAALGLVSIVIEAPTDARLAGTLVTVTEGGGRATRSLTLQPSAPNATVWFRDHQPGDALVVTGTHVLTDGREIDIAEITVDTSVVRLPSPFTGTITVEVVTDPVWSELTHVDVAIQKDETSPLKTFAFDAPGAAAVALDQTDPTDRSYRYKVTRTVSGVTTEDPWLTGDAPVLTVGLAAAATLVVDVEPVGPELPTAGLELIEVDLLYLDVPHQVRVTYTHLIRARSDSYHWVVPLADPTQRSYQYRVVKTLLAGGQSDSGWQQSADPILTVPITAGS